MPCLLGFQEILNFIHIQYNLGLVFHQGKRFLSIWNWNNPRDRRLSEGLCSFAADGCIGV